MKTEVVVIGGGLSGLAAAVRLASTGRSVVLLEQSQKLGGRCYSYRDETTGDIVENGQHLLLGAFHNLLDYLEIIGTRRLLRPEENLRLTFHDREKGFGEFRLSSLPRPFNLLAGMATYKLLSWRERKGLLRIGRFLGQSDDEAIRTLGGLSVKEWLDNMEQSHNAQQAFWNPIAISVMNDLPQHSSAVLFTRALRAAFLGSKSDSSVLLPTVGQTELYVDEAVRFLTERKSIIRTSAEVGRIDVRDNLAGGVTLRDGSGVAGKCVIAAVPYYALDRILPSVISSMPEYSRLRKFSSSPIISIHLWFDTDFMDQTFVGLIGRQVQWIFNRRKIIREHGSSPGAVSCVISGAFELIDWSKEELVRLALDEVAGVYPAAAKAALVHSLVIKEKRATLSSTAGIDSQRPGTRTPVRNFFLAGDWTATGLPATIEGAVKSGFAAAACAEELL